MLGAGTGDALKRPERTFAQLIAAAICSSADGRLSAREIYDWIEISYPYYRTCTINWRKTVRETLYKKRFFVSKGTVMLTGSGGHYWTLAPDAKRLLRCAAARSAPPGQIQDESVAVVAPQALESSFVCAEYAAPFSDGGQQATCVDRSPHAWAVGWGHILKALITCQPYDEQTNSQAPHANS